jgi:hypothetical protein
MQISDDNIPNLKDLLLSSQALNRTPMNAQQDFMNRVDTIKTILAEKLRRNLQSSCMLPIMATGVLNGQVHHTQQQQYANVHSSQ